MPLPINTTHAQNRGLSYFWFLPYAEAYQGCGSGAYSIEKMCEPIIKRIYPAVFEVGFSKAVELKNITILNKKNNGMRQVQIMIMK